MGCLVEECASLSETYETVNASAVQILTKTFSPIAELRLSRVRQF
jgi:hypothetical protein